MPGKERYPMSPYPLHLQNLGAVQSGHEFDEATAEALAVAPLEVERAYGRASIAGLQLHHVLTDVALAVTDDSVGKILRLTSGQLRTKILESADKVAYTGLRPYLQSWDVFLGQQSIKYRNHVVHSQLWSVNSQDVIGRIEGETYTVWTRQGLLAATTRIVLSTRLLSQIFWDVIITDYDGVVRKDVAPHFFYARQIPLMSDLQILLDMSAPELPPRTPQPA
ncbi:hypothetical protein ACFVTM_08925 [Arthrobacter sp. NPDC058130]|uniref:hypothetical protein n=1 Tax=Arthrobacter sp. NPDC058130 TaxID=3346353 RepID=UPI0036E1FAF5